MNLRLAKSWNRIYSRSIEIYWKRRSDIVGITTKGKADKMIQTAQR